MELLLSAIIILLGGLFKGLNGFGYAVISTTLLTTIMPPQQSVAIMIIPLMLANIEIVAKTTRKELKNCLKRFKRYILASITGVILGTLAINITPRKMLAQAIGLLTVIFVLSKTSMASKYFSKTLNYCAENPKIEPLLGLLSGTVFGGSNIGVPFVAYFQQIDLDTETFATMIALTVLLASAIRIPLSAYLGLYSGPQNIATSLLLSIPGLIGVELGIKTAKYFPEKHIWKTSLIIMAAIGLKLLGLF